MLRFQFDFVECLRGTTDYRRNKIKAVELASAYSKFVIESEQSVVTKIVKLVDVVAQKDEIDMTEVDKNIQLIIDYSRFYITWPVLKAVFWSSQKS